MILTCPECATSYFVDEARIPAEGRKVRCSSCGHRWRAGPDGEVIEPVAEAVDAAPEPEEAAPPEPAPELESDIVAGDPDPPLAVAPGLSRVAPSRRGRGEGRGSNALLWAGAAGLAAALIAGLVVFREQVVRAWPASSQAYAALGLQLAGGGLVLEGVKAQPAFLAGRPVLAVTGAIRNPRRDVIDAPPVRVTLFDKGGKPIAAKIARPADAAIPGGARRHFNITLIDPPASARDLEVRFESGQGKGAATHADARPQAASAHEAEAASPASAPPAEAAPHGEAPHGPASLSPAAAAEHG
jgi:predicted Zn finger-like uncharacterized protein